MTQLATWFWLSGVGGQVTATVTIRGYTVTTTARPVGYSWSFGDGSGATSSSAGTPSAPSVTHTYVTKGRYVVKVVIGWSGHYTFAGNGVGVHTVPLGTVDGPIGTDSYGVQEVRSVGTSGMTSTRHAARRRAAPAVGVWALAGVAAQAFIGRPQFTGMRAGPLRVVFWAQLLVGDYRSNLAGTAVCGLSGASRRPKLRAVAAVLVVFSGAGGVVGHGDVDVAGVGRRHRGLLVVSARWPATVWLVSAPAGCWPGPARRAGW